MTYLAVPISARNAAQAAEQVRRAVAGGAEMLELRMDYLEGITVDLAGEVVRQTRALAGTAMPLIVTCRDTREGGAIDYPESLRIEVLTMALREGAEFVDVEFANSRKSAFRRRIEPALTAAPKGRLILSAHDFARPFDDLRGLYREIVQGFPAAVPKLVYAAGHINDCFQAFDLLHKADRDCIVLCMGQAGLISRVLTKKLGGLVTFASLDEASGTAPGQVTLDAFKRLYHCDSIDRQTDLFGVIADPVGHSLSPAIHNACLADRKINGVYLPLLVQGGREELFAFLDHVLARPWLDFRGFSVTIPHKHSALDYVRQKGGFIEPLAEQIGAANTLVLDSRATSDGRRLGAYNSDYAGALDAIADGMGIPREGFRDMPVAVVGAGGVARAIVAGLTDAGAKVTIYNRTIERAEQLAADFGCAWSDLEGLSHLHARLLVNCTSIGMYPKVDATPVPPESLKPGMAVFDTVYNPAETLLLKHAKAAGARTIDGLAMFVNQALAQFHLFTGQSANPALMRNVVLDSLRSLVDRDK
ncbi:MAG TPA: type I 3-dehydroquinate dehydratase [Sedimentisphaerales bacterium]|nr:type I 3-dehydroquinate dehydratase [Sedimentisphaerales bacterium]HRS13120.1 type I 3-dehydroquinate dehydratase [Sedimentisphaerales bacterium]HRV49685.1 type I 3-dehydroquinate dehydratase [Sedimentisphaerales bacterium]